MIGSITVAAKPKTYDQGFNEGLAAGEKIGYAKRDKESPWESPEYWRWHECLFYNLTSALAALAVLVAFWLIGHFIRWEVGPIPQQSTIYLPSSGSCTNSSCSSTISPHVPGSGTLITPYSGGSGGTVHTPNIWSGGGDCHYEGETLRCY